MNNTKLCHSGFDNNQTDKHSKPSDGHTVYFEPQLRICCWNNTLFNQVSNKACVAIDADLLAKKQERKKQPN